MTKRERIQIAWCHCNTDSRLWCSHALILKPTNLIVTSGALFCWRTARQDLVFAFTQIRLSAICFTDAALLTRRGWGHTSVLTYSTTLWDKAALHFLDGYPCWAFMWRGWDNDIIAATSSYEDERQTMWSVYLNDIKSPAVGGHTAVVASQMLKLFSPQCEQTVGDKSQ